MSSGMLGADPEQLDDVALVMERSGETLRNAVTTVSGALEVVPWAGGDADGFRSDWTSSGAPSIEAGAQLLADHAEALRRNAEDQRRTSAADGVGTGGGPGGDILASLGQTFKPFADFVTGGLRGIGDVVSAFADAAHPSTFTESVSGQSPHEIDMDLAELSNDVYDFSADGSSDGLPEGWQRVSGEELSALGIGGDDLDKGGVLDLGSGFKAGVYKDADGRYVLAFAGTDMTSATDWATNAEQALGIDTKQYNQALTLARKVKAAYGDDLVVTGHSLGGGLASYAALGTDSAAVTFNAAGLSENSIENLGLDPDAARATAMQGQVRAYRTESDALTGLQEGGMDGAVLSDPPNAVGNPITIGNPVEEPSDWLWVLPPVGAGAHSAHAADMHRMPSVLDGMRGQDMTFSSSYSVITEQGTTEVHWTPQSYDGGWFDD